MSDDLVLRYIVDWRVKESIRRLIVASDNKVNIDSSILILCSGVGFEGTLLCDMGFKNVTVSDISDSGVNVALQRDSRLKGLTLNAQDTKLNDNSFDVVIVQDGLHHLPSPVQGFTEMLRVSRVASIFLEPHDSLVGRLIGSEWERNGQAINYVFRWNDRLVEQVTKSFLVTSKVKIICFSFCIII